KTHRDRNEIHRHAAYGVIIHTRHQLCFAQSYLAYQDAVVVHIVESPGVTERELIGGGVPSQQRVTMVAYYVGQGRASLGAESHHVAGIKVLAQSDWRVRPYVMVVAGDTRNMAHGRPWASRHRGTHRRS